MSGTWLSKGMGVRTGINGGTRVVVAQVGGALTDSACAFEVQHPQL